VARIDCSGREMVPETHIAKEARRTGAGKNNEGRLLTGQYFSKDNGVRGGRNMRGLIIRAASRGRAVGRGNAGVERRKKRVWMDGRTFRR